LSQRRRRNRIPTAGAHVIACAPAASSDAGSPTPSTSSASVHESILPPHWRCSRSLCLPLADLGQRSSSRCRTRTHLPLRRRRRPTPHTLSLPPRRHPVRTHPQIRLRTLCRRPRQGSRRVPSLAAKSAPPARPTRSQRKRRTLFARSPRTRARTNLECVHVRALHVQSADGHFLRPI